ncbi:MAG: NUDIX domain-containing protein [Chlamydiales bacterium]|nr:NUDIX domain-containing protein [Chlamydiales bacterium]
MHTVLPCVLTILLKDDQVLLLRRKNTGFRDGDFCLVGGKIELNEPATQAASREALEEVGLDLKNLEFVHVLHKMGERDDLIAFAFVATEWEGTLHNCEPEKHDLMQWFALRHLPKNILPAHKQVLEMFQNKIHYSEFTSS